MKTCFMCGQHCMNTSYYIIEMAIKPKDEQVLDEMPT